METIFDHNVTDEELKNLFGMTMTKKEYVNGLDQRKAYDHIFFLYQNRGDKKMAKKYLNKTPNDKRKFFEVLNVDYSGYKHFKEDYEVAP